MGSRVQYALQGFSQTQFFYGTLDNLLYDPSLAPYISRSDAIATRTITGGSAFAIYPISRYSRYEVSGGALYLNEQYTSPDLQALADQQQAQTGQPIFSNGVLIPFSAAFVQETTIFREFGPLAGSTTRVSYEIAPKIGNTLSRQTVELDLRHYQRLGTTGLLATRLRAFRSGGANPGFLYFGGNSEMRGYDYLQFVGQNAVFANAELRFPIIEAALTPVGIIGGIRGVFFANIGAGWFDNQGFKFATSQSQTVRQNLGVEFDASGQPALDLNGNQIPVYGPDQVISGFRLQDGRGSYGFGLETFALGFPIHFDWAWRTLFNQDWENFLFSDIDPYSHTSQNNGSANFRKPQFGFWIGYDF
jgi:hypothetical protein